MALGDFFSGAAFFVIVLLIIAVWIIVEIRRFRHKIFAVFLILLILFLYISTVVVFNEQELDLTSFSGVVSATKLYLSWLASAGDNLKTMAANAIKLEWGFNNTDAKNNV